MQRGRKRQQGRVKTGLKVALLMQLSRSHGTSCYGKARNFVCNALSAPMLLLNGTNVVMVLLNRVNLFTMRLVVLGNPASDSALYIVLGQGS